MILTFRLAIKTGKQGRSVHTHKKSFLVFAVMVAGLSACGGDSGSCGPPTVDVTGTWTGSWVSQNAFDGGSATLAANQTDGAVVGTASFSGSPCFSGGSFRGTVCGNEACGSLTSGGIRVDVCLGVIGDNANGTYNTISAGLCTGDRGTISLSR